jgi:diguanylate cyclase (GGDEF)-like protein
MRPSIKKQLKIYLPALLNVALFGAVVSWFILNDIQQEIDVIHRRLALLVFVIFTAVLLVSGYIVFQGIMFEKERNRMARKLKNLASTDPLTGALNRRHFWRTADMELHRHHRYFRELAMLVMDIDHFKRINDTFGHPTGDKVLRELVKSCVKNLRKSDIFGRIGGEEFAVLLVETQAEASVEVADRLRQQLAAIQTIVDGGIPINFTVSIGVTHARREDESLDDLIKRADAALEQAKSKGRNRVETSY